MYPTYSPYPETPQILYQLEDKAPVKDYFIGRLIGAIALFLAMIFLPGGMKFLSMIGFFAVAIPLGTEFFNHQLKQLTLTDRHLSLVTGFKEEHHLIEFADIKSVEVIEKYKNRKRGGAPIRKGETSTILVHDDNRHAMNYHPDTRCIIFTNDGRKVQLKARYFKKGQFAKFLSMLQQSYNGFQQNLAAGKANPSLNTQQQKTNYTPQAQIPLQKTPETQQKLSENEAKINQVAESNRKFLQDDLELKKDLESNMLEVYKSVYKIRDAFDMSKMVQPKVIHQFKNPDGANSYILENDFHADLDKDSLDIGNNLIDAAQKNLNVVETRIAYYKKIDRELEKLKFQEQNRQRLQSVAANLKNLQDKNTNKSIDQSLTGMDNNVEEKVLADLENLSHQVQKLEDLENSIWLNEHISLFKNANLGA
jgi:hypothetical protein